MIDMTTEQEQIVSKSYDWLAKVLETQQRWLSDRDLWVAYPFKKTGLSKEGLSLLITKMKEQ
jgi:hypothetical protein